MKKLFRRCLAYFIDMMVIILIAQCISGIPQINKQLDEYNEYYGDYISSYGQWAAFKSDIVKSFEDKELTLEEYDALIEEHDTYKDVLDKYYKDGKLTEKNYDKLNKEVDNDYDKEYEKIYFNIEKNSICYMIVYLVAVFAYFVGFNLITNGQTLGKKLTRLKIVNNDDVDVRVSVWSYLVRALILYQPICYIIKLIGIGTMSMNMYSDVTSVIYTIQGYLEMLIILMLMIRTDGRGPHDFLAKTRVALYNRNGEEIVDKPDLLTKKVNEVKEKTKKIIDEPTE